MSILKTLMKIMNNVSNHMPEFYTNFVRIWQHEYPASVVLERSEQQDSLLDTLHQPRPQIWATSHLTCDQDYPMVG